MSRVRHVIVIGIDGLRPDMVTPATMPVLAALRDEGACSGGHRTVYPSETRGALTALACGARPETTGVLGNEFFARGARPELTRTNTIHDWRAAEARLPGGMVTATSLAEALAKSGRTLAIVNSSGQGSATALCWGCEAMGHASFNIRNPQIAYPATLAADIEAAHEVPPGGHDGLAAQAAVAIFTRTVWPARRPDVAILWLTEVDGASHRFGLGAPGMLASMAHCDAAIGDVLAWRAGLPEHEDVAVVVTSDHGHATIGAFVSVAERLSAAGIGTEGIVSRRGRAPAFWLNGADPARLSDIASALAEAPWAGAMFSAPAEPGATEGILPGTLSVALTGAGHRRAPDLIVHLAGTDDLNPYGVPGIGACDAGGYKTPLGGGTHGGMHPAELNAMLVLHGAGAGAAGLRDTRSGIQDLAPTVLHLLGLAPAPGMTGRILHEMLDGGPPVAAPELFSFEAAVAGRVSRLRLARVEGAPYVDAAEHGPAETAPRAPRRRDDLRVAEPAE